MVQLGRQQVNAMAARGRNPPAQPALQGADPALVQILQMMQNRDANRGQFPQAIFDVSQRILYRTR